VGKGRKEGVKRNIGWCTDEKVGQKSEWHNRVEGWLKRWEKAKGFCDGNIKSGKALRWGRGSVESGKI
jgi:hypothetical protein